MRIRDVLVEHQFQEWQYGDGYSVIADIGETPGVHITLRIEPTP